MADILDRLIQAHRCEDIFGSSEGTCTEQQAHVKKLYRELAQVCHPDRAKAEDRGRAEQAFEKLNLLRYEAEAAVKAGTYGTNRVEPIIVSSKRNSYTICGPVKAGDLASLYPVTYGTGSLGLLKVAATSADNDLVAAEAEILRHLLSPDKPEATGFGPMLPALIESFDLRDASGQRRVNAFVRAEGFYNLETVRRAFPAGLDPKHVAWIWRQLLLILGYAHARGVIHGAVLPHHILIHPSHDLLLVDWCFAVRDPADTGTHIPAVSDRYSDWYPAEVTSKSEPTPATDIAMSARCMLELLGNGTRPGTKRTGAFLASCLIPAQGRRPQDAWALRDEFTRLIEQLWGPRRRIPFSMPNSHP